MERNGKASKFEERFRPLVGLAVLYVFEEETKKEKKKKKKKTMMMMMIVGEEEENKINGDRVQQ